MTVKRVAGPASWFQTPSTSGTPQASSARQICAAPAMPLSKPVSSTGLCCGAQVRIGSLRENGLDADERPFLRVVGVIAHPFAERTFRLCCARHRFALDGDFTIGR